MPGLGDGVGHQRTSLGGAGPFNPWPFSLPRLYSAGELGSIFSYLYQGTGNIGECLTFGRASSRHAVAEGFW